MLRNMMLLLWAVLMLNSCAEKEKVEIVMPNQIPQLKPTHFSLWKISEANPLPTEVADGYLELGRAPQMSFGLLLLNGDMKARSHDTHDVMIYVHGGAAWLTVNNERNYVRTGHAMYIPKGAIYSAEKMTDVPVELFVVYTPPFDGSDLRYIGE